MIYLARRYSGTSSRIGRFPWLMFLFLAAVFFLSQHDLFYSNRVTDTFNPSEDDIVTAVAKGSLSRAHRPIVSGSLRPG